jgi:hypothetical protein
LTIENASGAEKFDVERDDNRPIASERSNNSGFREIQKESIVNGKDTIPL